MAEHHIGHRRRPCFLAHEDPHRAPADRTLHWRHFVKRPFRHREPPLEKWYVKNTAAARRDPLTRDRPRDP